jgi:hypothetical protein
MLVMILDDFEEYPLSICQDAKVRENGLPYAYLFCLPFGFDAVNIHSYS